MKLLIATHNPGKFQEIAAGLSGIPIKLVSLRDLGIRDEVEETGKTHEENAFLKASYFGGKTGLSVLAEDSGVYVDAFPGELGVETRRFRGLHSADDKTWVETFLYAMESVPDRKRGAKFVCYACLLWQGEPLYFSGETHGKITKKLEAPLSPGIPLSSCFKPDGFSKVYANLEVEEKNQISHRGKAIAKARQFLIAQLSAKQPRFYTS